MRDSDFDLRSLVRNIPDYPKAGVMFRDITTLFGDADGLRICVDRLTEPYRGNGIEAVAGIEARGFILGDYELEYGVDVIEIHEDAIREGERVLLIDDLLATGGTAEAAAKLLHKLGAELVGAAFVIDLPDLGGHDRLRRLGIACHTLMEFEGD